MPSKIDAIRARLDGRRSHQASRDRRTLLAWLDEAMKLMERGHRMVLDSNLYDDMSDLFAKIGADDGE